MNNQKNEFLEKTWCNIEGCYGYMISNHGDVISFRRRNSKEINYKPIVLKQSTITTHCGKKYNRVKLFNKEYYVHRLVAIHFIDNQNNKPQVNHIDGDSQNNIATNLEWATNSENQIHRFQKNGTKNDLGRYIYKNRGTYRVYKQNVIDKCFKTLSDAQEFAKQYFL